MRRVRCHFRLRRLRGLYALAASSREGPMRNILLAAIATMLMGCTTAEMKTVAPNTGPQQANEASLTRYEPPPPPQLSQPPNRGSAANYRSTPRLAHRRAC